MTDRKGYKVEGEDGENVALAEMLEADPTFSMQRVLMLQAIDIFFSQRVNVLRDGDNKPSLALAFHSALVPGYKMTVFAEFDGEICEDCKGGCEHG